MTEPSAPFTTSPSKGFPPLMIPPCRKPVSFDDLAMMLEIDLMLGRRPDFKRRLRRALVAAASQIQPAQISSLVAKGKKLISSSKKRMEDCL